DGGGTTTGDGTDGGGTTTGDSTDGGGTTTGDSTDGGGTTTGDGSTSSQSPGSEPAPAAPTPENDFIDSAKMDELISTQLSHDSKIVVEAKTTGDTAQTIVNAAAFGKISAAAKDAALVIQSGLSTVSVSADSMKKQLEELSIAPGQAKIAVIVTKSAAAVEAIAKNGVHLLTTPVTVEVQVTTEDGRKLSVQPALKNSLVLPETAAGISTKHLAGVVIDPVTNEMFPVPVTFTDEGGKRMANLPNRGNLAYAVVENDKSFKDVPASHYAKESIDVLASKLIVTGESSDLFVPDRNVSRAEYATLLTRALGIVPQAEADSAFPDVAADNVHARAIAAAAMAGLINGYTDGTFRPNEEITRQEMVQMIFNAMRANGYAQEIKSEEKPQWLAAFGDRSQIPDWASDAAAAAVKAGIIQGVAANEFAPSYHADRAQGAAVVLRMMQTLQIVE
ncbi:S-layer homology domain-containing protein, partial [Paenibacillus chartarius]